MRPLIFLVTIFVMLGAPATVLAGPREDVAAATQAWVEAFNSREPARVLALYDAEAVFWGTTSPTLRDTPALIREYFSTLPSRPHGRVALSEQRVRVQGDIAINTGYYTFSNVRDGQTVATPARFSFTYRLVNGRWLILDHHSSPIPTPRPQPETPPVPTSTAPVRGS